MDAQRNLSNRPTTLRDVLLRGVEPSPLARIARLPLYPWLVVGTVCIGAFMGRLTRSTSTTGAARARARFRPAAQCAELGVGGYLLTLAAPLPVFGRLADLYGRKPMYTCGFLLFIASDRRCAGPRRTSDS